MSPHKPTVKTLQDNLQIKLLRFLLDLDQATDEVPVYLTLALSCSVLMGGFQSVQPEGMNRILQEVRIITCALESRPSWLSKKIFREGWLS